MTQPLRLGIAYDLRNPPGSGYSNSNLYGAVLDQVAFADQLGFDQVWLTEHHFVDDGYLPSFVPVAGAIAARTSRIRISTDIALLPFYQPLRLAEDLAVLDTLSDGRMELGIGMGYIPSEFEAFGVPFQQRVSRTEEAIAILQQAWSPDPVRFSGRRFSYDGINVYPKPVQEGGIPLWLASTSPGGAERAARLGLNFLPQGPRGETLDVWKAALPGHGRRQADFRVGIIRPWLVTDDPDRDWPPVKAAEVYRAKRYRDWIVASRDNASGWQDPTRIPQTWIVGDAGHCLTEIESFVAEYELTDLVSWVGAPGVHPARMNASLERFASEVMPKLRASAGRR